jgi:YD repeat-containing protein
MTERPEPFVFERVWAHPASAVPDDAPTAMAVLDDVGRLVGTRYSDGGEESYEYEEEGRVVAIEEARANALGTAGGAV